MNYRLVVKFLDFDVFDGYFKSLNSSIRMSLNFSDECDFYLENVFTEKVYPIDCLREVLRNA